MNLDRSAARGEAEDLPSQRLERLGPFHWLITLLAGLGFTSSGISFGALSFTLPAIRAEWLLEAATAGLLISASGVGQMGGAVLVGNLSDRLGRRRAYALTAAMSGTGTLLAGLAPGPIWLALALFLAGLGFGGVAPVSTSLISEFAPARARGQLVAWTQVLFGVGWAVSALGGAFLIAPLGWRPVFGLGVLSLGLAYVAYRLVPESPRFLLAHGRAAEARALVEYLETKHGVRLPLPPQRQAGERVSIFSRLRLLWSPVYRRRTAAVWFTWAAMLASFNGPVVWLPALLAMGGLSPSEASGWGAATALAQAPGALVAVALIDRAGRKPLLVGSLALSALGLLGLAFMEGTVMVVAWGCCLAFALAAAWPVILTYASELYPTFMRSTATGLAAASGRVVGFSSPTVLGLMLAPWGLGRDIGLSAYALVLLSAICVISAFGEETSGRTLEELSD